jgi:erythromycin esterase-like protein
MGWQGEFNIGESCRAAFGDSAVLIGFGTDRGTVATASDWDGPMEVKKVIPAWPDSYEYVFRQASVERMFCRSPGSSAPSGLSTGQKQNS